MKLTNKQLRAIHAKNQDPFERKHHSLHGDPTAHPIPCAVCGNKSMDAYVHGGVCSKQCQERLIRNSNFPFLIKERFGVSARKMKL